MWFFKVFITIILASKRAFVLGLQDRLSTAWFLLYLPKILADGAERFVQTHGAQLAEESFEHNTLSDGSLEYSMDIVVINGKFD